MSNGKTLPTGASVEAHLAQITPAGRQKDAVEMDAIFRDVTGFVPQMWGTSIVGYGRYDYTYKSGRGGTFLATGFAARKSNMVVYILPGYSDFSDILQEIGPHKTGQSCLYLGALSKVNTDALRRLIRAGLDALNTEWPVQPA